MGYNLSINPTETVSKIKEFIGSTVHTAGFSRIVVGLSGGIDSAVSASLAVKALGADNVFVGLFPYGELNEEGMEDAKIVVKELKIPADNVTLIDIKPLVDPIISAAVGKVPIIAHDRDKSSNNNSQKNSGTVNLRKGNMMVRMRMILLYDLSKKYEALVLGTENKTEHLLGYFTRFGDEASDIEPIINLYKTQILELAKNLKLPDKIIRKAPTAGMWQGQTDEGEFGFTYRQADEILNLYFDQKKNEEEIASCGIGYDIIKKVLSKAKINSFKHITPYKLTSP